MRLAILLRKWSGRRDSNPQLPAWEADTLPLSYARIRGKIEGGRMKDEVKTNYPVACTLEDNERQERVSTTLFVRTLFVSLPFIRSPTLLDTFA